MRSANRFGLEGADQPGAGAAVVVLAERRCGQGVYRTRALAKGQSDGAVSTRGCRQPRQLSRDRGASAVEYALLIAGIAAVIIVAVTFVGKSVSSQFSKVGSSISTTN